MTQLPPPPQLGPPPGAPPVWTDGWECSVLLTPFADSQLATAEVSFLPDLDAMVIVAVGLQSGEPIELLQIGGSTYVALDGTWTGPVDMGWRTPAADLLSQISATCVGTADLLGTNCAWWVSQSPCTNAYENPSSPKTTVGNWIYVDAQHGDPRRMVFVDTTNPLGLPLLGEYAMVHCFPLDGGAGDRHRELAAAVPHRASPAADALTPADVVARFTGAGDGGSFVPGLAAPTGSDRLPSWPDTLYMTALVTSTADATVQPTRIYYDWTIERMLTELEPIASDPDTTKLILTGDLTYTVTVHPDGTHKCGPPQPPGLPYPDWPTRDSGTVRGVLAGPVVGGRTLQLIVLGSDHGRVFWIWYTTDDEAVLFTEVPQLCDVGLLLVDYASVVRDPRLDGSLFDIPPDCLG